MRIVVAPDSFKGSIDAARAADALAAGWREVRPGDEVRLLPMADGGEGTLDAFFVAVPGARRIPVVVSGPHNRSVEASWVLLPNGTGVVELASTSGIELLSGALRPWDADTFGFGQAIAAALDHGVHELVLGIGSSASTDGGAGVLRALGARLTDDAGADVAPGLRGLAAVASIDLSALRPLPAGGVTVLSDVVNPLCGAHGAAAVYGAQKGLDAEGIAAADLALARWASLLADAGRSARDQPGAGAAGGTGFALRMWGAGLVPGATAVAAIIGLPDAVADADLVLTGEGAFDGQSSAGKVPSQVQRMSSDAAVPVALVAGRIADDADTAAFAAIISLTELAGSTDAALADPARWLRAAGAELARRHDRA